MKKASVLAMVCIMVVMNAASAEIIRGIDIDFVTIGHAGNGPDTQVMQDSTTGYGAVAYNYRISKYEVSNAQWNVFDVSAPLTNAQQPVVYIDWYEAIQFCNYLTSGDKSKGAYLFSGNNSNPGNFYGIDRQAAKAAYGTIYVLPTEDEWYKAAYYKPDGSGFSLYANGSNAIPEADNGWNYYPGPYDSPWDVGTGTMEQNGTYDMMGNVWEWNETLVAPPPNYSERGLRGGSYQSFGHEGGTYGLPSSYRNYAQPYLAESSFGFRVASSIPEPATLLFLGLGMLMVRRKS